MMDEETDAVKANYGEHYDRLSRIKARYDPENLLRVSQNIKPAGDKPGRQL
jgi:FAD/FMN-containing dehydrogenase